MKKLLILTLLCFSNLSALTLSSISNHLLDTGINPGLITFSLSPANFTIGVEFNVTKFLSIKYNQSEYSNLAYSSFIRKGYVFDHYDNPVTIDFSSLDMNEVCDGNSSWDCAYGFDSEYPVDAYIDLRYGKPLDIPNYFTRKSILHDVKIQLSLNLY